GIAERVRRSNGHFAIALGVPRQAAARIEVRPLPVCGRLLRKAGVAGKIETRGCIHELSALGARQEASQVEIRDLAVGDLLRQERLPTDAEVEGEPRIYLPGVGEVEIDGILPRGV